MPKTVVEKFSFNELKIEKVKLFTQNSTKFFCISVINVGGCLASCLTFRPFLTLNPEQLGCLWKKMSPSNANVSLGMLQFHLISLCIKKNLSKS